MHKYLTAAEPLPSRLLSQLLANIGMAVLYGIFAYSFLQSLQVEVRLSAMLALITASLDAVFFLIRRFPRTITASPYAWSTAVCASSIVFMLRPAGGAEDMPLGTLLQVIGFGIEVLAVIELRRSMGIVPADRGIKQDGPYRYVRHPLYLGSLLFFIGFVSNHCSAANLALVLTWMLVTVTRIEQEERLLSREPEYVVYKCRVPWRLIPRVY